ncbi:MAG TPA: metalloregulator ArsR/SmtB family transcription factor [Candidatus Limnocylindria bacterium]
MIKNHYEMTQSRTSAGERDLRRLRTLYKALGDETRLRIIGLMAELGPVPVKTLSARVGLSQPLISWHLRILRLAGVIDTKRQGREVICRLRLAAFEELHEVEARLVAGTAGIDMAPATGSEATNVG